MNKDQRKYLLDAVSSQHREELNKLNDRRPKAPSLNNYLVAAILDGSFRMKPEAAVRSAILARVRDLGRGEALIENQRHWQRDEAGEDCVVLPALLLFDEPPAYTEARVAYEAQLKQWEQEYDTLEAAFKAMTLKIQIGSAEALQGLIAQADALCSLSLSTINQRLLLGPTTTKEKT